MKFSILEKRIKIEKIQKPKVVLNNANWNLFKKHLDSSSRIVVILVEDFIDSYEIDVHPIGGEKKEAYKVESKYFFNPFV